MRNARRTPAVVQKHKQIEDDMRGIYSGYAAIAATCLEICPKYLPGRTLSALFAPFMKRKIDNFVSKNHCVGKPILTFLNAILHRNTFCCFGNSRSAAMINHSNQRSVTWTLPCGSMFWRCVPCSRLSAPSCWVRSEFDPRTTTDSKLASFASGAK
jgi:hypothetical protein